jgi:hypothetical protein
MFEDGESVRGVVAIEDCVETNGGFILHHLIKRHLSSNSSNLLLVFVALAQPFSHYDRILRKMGINLAAQRDNKRLLFLDMLMLDCPEGDAKGSEFGLIELYGKIQNAVQVCALDENKGNISIMIDDISLMEVASHGSSNHVIDFLHYCHTLTTQFGCSLVVLNHEDVYSSTNKSALIVQTEYLADLVIKTEPLTTGLANDVHGQVTVINKGRIRDGDNDGIMRSRNKLRNFHFKVRDNIVDYFYPGSRS